MRAAGNGMRENAVWTRCERSIGGGGCAPKYGDGWRAERVRDMRRAAIIGYEQREPGDDSPKRWQRSAFRQVQQRTRARARSLLRRCAPSRRRATPASHQSRPGATSRRRRSDSVASGVCGRARRGADRSAVALRSREAHRRQRNRQGRVEIRFARRRSVRPGRSSGQVRGGFRGRRRAAAARHPVHPGLSRASPERTKPAV